MLDRTERERERERESKREMTSSCGLSIQLQCHLSVPQTFGRSNLFSKRSKTKRSALLQRSRAMVDDRKELNENPEGIISGEWPQNFSLLCYDDVRAYLEPEISKSKMQSSATLGEVMSAAIRTATTDQTLEEIDYHFDVVSGLPVVDDLFRCIGILSKRDKQRASSGLRSKVREVMSSPVITLSANKTVVDAAALMLNKKIHRIPIVNERCQIVGIVTRTDIFKALEGIKT